MNYNDIRLKNFPSGTKIWACAYTYSSTKENRALFQEPIYGILSSTNKEYQKDLIDDTSKKAKYFIPFKKNTTEFSYDNLAFSKAVLIMSRYYAQTEEECIEIYNSLIQSNIDWHLSEIEILKENLIKNK